MCIVVATSSTFAFCAESPSVGESIVHQLPDEQYGSTLVITELQCEEV